MSWKYVLAFVCVMSRVLSDFISFSVLKLVKQQICYMPFRQLFCSTFKFSKSAMFDCQCVCCCFFCCFFFKRQRSCFCWKLGDVINTNPFVCSFSLIYNNLSTDESVNSRGYCFAHEMFTFISCTFCHPRTSVTFSKLSRQELLYNSVTSSKSLMIS